MRKSTVAWQLAAAISVALMTQTASADDLQALKAQMATMQKRIAELETKQAAAPKASSKSANKDSGWNANSEALKLYGQARVSVDHVSGNGTTATGTSIVSNASRFGVKGKLPSGLGDSKLIYQAELRYETTDDAAGTAGKNVEFREGYAGLESKTWGKVRLGRLSTGYKTSLTKIDPWNDNAPQSRSGGRQGTSELHSSYFNNAIEYVSPKIGSGLKFNAWAASEFNTSTKPLHNTGTLKNYKGGDAKGAGVKYKNKSTFLAADVIDINADDTSGKANLSNGSGWQVAGRHDFGKFSLAGMYEDVENLGLGKNTYVNGIYKAGKNKFIAGYGRNRNGAVYGNKDWDDWSLGVKHKLNKKSELFAAYNSRRDKTADTDVNTLTTGINVKFGY